MNNLRQRLEEYMQLAFRFLLCISAYIPLFIILVLKNIDNLGVCAVLIIVFIFIPILVVRMYISHPLRGEANAPIVIKTINRKESEILNYISGYIISLISFNSDIFTEQGIDIPNLLGLSLLFLVICSLYMKARMYDVNPVLSLFYDILDVTDDNDENITLLVERKLDVPKDRTVLVRMISPGIYLHTNVRKNKITKVKIALLILILLVFLFIWNQEFKDIITSNLELIKNILTKQN
ncbi:MAG: hypothetical protein RSD96_03915 [Bacilli bacterium]